MSRFGSLEFDNHEEEGSAGRGASRSGIKDASYFMAEAQRAFEEAAFEKALRSYGRVLEYNPNQAAAWTGQVRMLIELGQFQEANVWADKAIEQFPREPELLAAKGVALARTRDFQGAMAFSDSAAEESGDTPYVWLARGDALLAGREKHSGFCFSKALAMTPRDWFTRWLVARIHCDHRHFSLGLKYAQESMALDAARSAVWMQLGLCQQGLGLFGPAQQSFTQARELNPDNRIAIEQLARLANLGWRSWLAGRWRQFFRT